MGCFGVFLDGLLTALAALAIIAILVLIVSCIANDKKRPHFLFWGRLALIGAFAGLMTWLSIWAEVYALLVLPVFCIVFIIWLIYAGPDYDE